MPHWRRTRPAGRLRSTARFWRHAVTASSRACSTFATPVTPRATAVASSVTARWRSSSGNDEPTTLALVAPTRRRPHPVGPVFARLPAAPGPAWHVLCAPARRRRDGACDLRAQLGLLHRSYREEAVGPFSPGIERVVFRHRGLLTGMHVLPELGHLEEPRDGPVDGRSVALPGRRGRPRERRRERGLHLQRSRD